VDFPFPISYLPALFFSVVETLKVVLGVELGFSLIGIAHHVDFLMR